MIDIESRDKEPVLYVGKDEVEEAVGLLNKADLIVGHNICGYDIQVIEKVTGVRLKNKMFDTLTIAQLICPDVKKVFYKDPETGEVITGKGQNLKAWGIRLKCYKKQYDLGFDEYSEEMGTYCMQDTKVTYELYKYLLSKKWPQSSIEFEMSVARIIADIGNYGIYFDVEEGQKLYAELLEKYKIIADEARLIFPPWFKFTKMFTYKKTNAEVCKIELTEFNPNSRTHIIDRLQNKYNWKPTKFTEKGAPIMDTKVLASMDYPEAKKLSELFMLNKRISQLATGKEAWLLHIKEDGRIHGRINQNGARTGRCTHQKPNLSQVPKAGKEYGEECRKLFRAAPGKILIGCDFTGLEFAVLAGYMVKYDRGRLRNIVMNGDKDKGTDIHTINAKAMGVDRTTAKTLLYAMMYGGGAEKAGSIINSGMSELQKKEVGREIRDRLLDSMDGIKDFIADIQKAYRQRAKQQKSDKGFTEYVNGWLKGLDGRPIYCDYEYMALNTVLQSAGALISKRGLVELTELLEKEGLIQNKHYGIVIYSHDEWDIECDPKDKEIIKQKSLEACVRAGEYFKFPCKMSGEVQEGDNWNDIH
jgi:DNA polymerase I-like protein with 3'-5' exonuclease and polymerase domains